MNSKAIKRQLLAAIAMVLVAAIALGSSTYAWFASNNKVTAEGMKITATTEGANLEISLDKNNFKAGTMSATSTDVGTTLLPTHYVTTADKENNGNYANSTEITTAGVWAHAYSHDYKEVSTTGTYENAVVVDPVGTLGDSVTKTPYSLVVPVYLRLNPQSKIQVENIKGSVKIEWKKGGTADAGATGMTTAGRVAFITDTTNKTVIDGKGLANGDSTTASLGTIETAGNTGIITIYAVIYFDGDDTSCTSEKFAADEYTVTLTFEGDISRNTPVKTTVGA